VVIVHASSVRSDKVFHAAGYSGRGDWRQHAQLRNFTAKRLRRRAVRATIRRHNLSARQVWAPHACRRRVLVPLAIDGSRGRGGARGDVAVCWSAAVAAPHVWIEDVILGERFAHHGACYARGSVLSIWGRDSHPHRRALRVGADSDGCARRVRRDAGGQERPRRSTSRSGFARRAVLGRRCVTDGRCAASGAAATACGQPTFVAIVVMVPSAATLRSDGAIRRSNGKRPRRTER
jgi:hypothetical protein